jgi:glycosyltransferase involved in cell wall biosynthesis
MGRYLPAIVVLARARDRYQLPLSLTEVDLLDELITEWYWPVDRRLFRHTMGRMVPQSVIEARYRPGLSSHHVRIDKQALLYAGFAQLGLPRPFHWYTNRALSRSGRQRAAETGMPLFCYSYYAFDAFRPGRYRPEYRFLFQLHPHPASVRTLLLQELESNPGARDSLMMEQELALPQRQYVQLCGEPHLANGWVVASSFTARTLVEHGIPQAGIHVVPYGVDSTAFPARLGERTRNERLRVIFVGSMIQRKGLSYLLDAARMLGTRQIQLVICGRGFVDHRLLAAYDDVGAEIRIGLSREQLVRELHESDVFVLPSLAEGFAHVILEAMAAGLPIITTDHTGGPDVAREGEHGFIVPIRSAESIAERLAWCLAHRPELEEMGRAAAKQARLFSWERFREGIVTAYRGMCDNRCSPPTPASTNGAAPSTSELV